MGEKLGPFDPLGHFTASLLATQITHYCMLLQFFMDATRVELIDIQAAACAFCAPGKLGHFSPILIRLSRGRLFRGLPIFCRSIRTQQAATLLNMLDINLFRAGGRRLRTSR